MKLKGGGFTLYLEGLQKAENIKPSKESNMKIKYPKAIPGPMWNFNNSIGFILNEILSYKKKSLLLLLTGFEFLKNDVRLF